MWSLRRSTTIWRSCDINLAFIHSFAFLVQKTRNLRLFHLRCISPQGKDSTDDEPPIEEYTVEDNPSGSKRSKAENSHVREKTLRRFLNRRGHLLPAPDREEVYPLETLSAKRGKNHRINL